MRRVYIQETWPASWKFSYGFDLNEVFGEVSPYGYAFAYENRRNMTPGAGCADWMRTSRRPAPSSPSCASYPYAQRDHPPETKHLSPGGKKWSAAQPRGLAYFATLARTIGQEPPIERDRIILAMLVPLGIEKGKPFNPDESRKDSTGAWLDGGKTYSLHVPKDAPVAVAQFWSFTVYDNESRCLIDTGTYPDRSSRDDITKNSDGSTDLYFGPEAPAGKPAKNWVKTLPGKGWFTYFRLYGPTQPYFDRTWVLPDIEPAK